MKTIYFLLPLLFISVAVFAQDDDETSIKTQTKSHAKEGVIVIEKGDRGILKRGRKAKVESGDSEIVGDEMATPQAAKREWDARCTSWKNELRTMNGKNLLVADCGRPKMKSEMRQSEKSYTYESIAKYKIRVVDDED